MSIGGIKIVKFIMLNRISVIMDGIYRLYIINE